MSIRSVFKLRRTVCDDLGFFDRGMDSNTRDHFAYVRGFAYSGGSYQGVDFRVSEAVMTVEWLEATIVLVVALFGLCGWMLAQRSRDLKDLTKLINEERTESSQSRSAIYEELRNHTKERGALQSDVAVLKTEMKNMRGVGEAINSKLDTLLTRGNR